MRRLKRNSYCVALYGNQIRLCPMKDGGPEWFAGDFDFQAIPDPADPDLIADIAETLGLAVGHVIALIAGQKIQGISGGNQFKVPFFE